MKFDFTARIASKRLIAYAAALMVAGSTAPEPHALRGVVHVSPLIIDLNGDGIRTVALADSGYYFDLNNDFRAEQTAWPYPFDGLLVLDRNGDGKIDHGAELFGNYTPMPDGRTAANGFEALAAFDADKDGFITSRDPIFHKLRVWRDISRTGRTTPADLYLLEDLGIEAIGVRWTESKEVDAGGSAHRQVGVVQINGNKHLIADVWLATSLSRTIERGPTVLPPDVAALPHARAFGGIRDLRPAMHANGRLKELVAQYANAQNVATADRMLDAILFEWTGASAIERTSRGHTIDARYLTALEQFVGEPFQYSNGVKNPKPKSAHILMEQYVSLRAFFRAQLLAQTHYRDEFQLSIGDYDPRFQLLPVNLPAFTEKLQQLERDGNSARVLDLYCTLAAFDLYDGYGQSGEGSLRSHPAIGKLTERLLESQQSGSPATWASDPVAEGAANDLSLGCIDLLRSPDSKVSILARQRRTELSARADAEREAQMLQKRVTLLAAAILLMALLVAYRLRRKRGE